MKYWMAVFGVLLGLCALVAFVSLATDSTGAAGQPHKDHPAMNVGGDASRHDLLAVPAFLYGALLIALFFLLLKPGIRTGQRGWGLLAGIGGLCVLALAGVFLLYEQTKGQQTATMILGFPSATAMLLFVLWPLPVLVVVLYARRFDEWILSPDEHREFRARLAARSPEES